MHLLLRRRRRRPFGIVLSALVLHLGLASPSRAGELVSLPTDHATFVLDDTGSLTGIVRAGSRRNYLPPDAKAPVLSLRRQGVLLAPDRAEWNLSAQQLVLHYGAPDRGLSALIRLQPKGTHLTFELVWLSPAAHQGLDWVLWGPYPTSIREIIGETVGVVRDREFALGIQALNVKTLGGYPKAENDAEGEGSDDDVASSPELPAELLKGQHYRTDTARRTPFGSVLQAYCRQRDQERVVANWGHPAYVVPAFADGGVVGSRIALFAAPADAALDTLGAIELAEGLPHPMIDGVWGKQSPGATASYLIVDFGEATVDRAIEMTRRAGLRYLYHSSPFETWGHFRLKPGLFPNGWAGLKQCIDKARDAGVAIGVHTLSNFITPNDPYVTPRPDPRLARIGSSVLTAEVDAFTDELGIAETNFFVRPSTMNTVRIGEELVRFAKVSSEAPWRLLGCERGAWGTRPSAHARGTSVDRLLDHEYRVFLSDAGLSQEIARNLADLFNQTGALQLSFDGLEGNWSTGYGKYGCALFTTAWYNALRPELRGRVINDASLPGHFSWHLHTRMNWGEPWYGGFRESQTLYRFKNQVYFERNLMPRMLGWFALRPDTSLEDAEWLLARAAGFNAGFTLATSLASNAQLEADPASAETARRFGATTAILELIRQWETARMANAFPADVREALRDNQREFHLEPAGPSAWDLSEVHLARFNHDGNRTDTGEYRFTHRDSRQPLQWVLRSTAKEPVRDVTVTLDGRVVVASGDQAIPPGGSLRYSGGQDAVVADAAWKEVARLPVQASAAVISPGDRRVIVRTTVESGAGLKMELRALATPRRLIATR